MRAAVCGHVEVVRFLVEVGATKDVADNDGLTALMVAAVPISPLGIIFF